MAGCEEEIGRDAGSETLSVLLWIPHAQYKNRPCYGPVFVWVCSEADVL